MNCAYHIHNPALVNCNGCGKPLCPACDHRVKGFPYCQDCIVMGVDLLRQHNKSDYAPFVKKRTSPIVATLLSMLCPGLGAAYNGQTTKALVYFAVFVGLFQLAILVKFPIFVFGFMGMWLFAALDAWRTAQMIRSGVTPDNAEDILVRRFSGNPKLWGIVLAVLGAAFILRQVFDFGFILRAVMPLFLIGLGFYLLRGYIFKPKSSVDSYMDRDPSPAFVTAVTEQRYQQGDYSQSEGYSDRSRSGAWRDR
jgi:TM2 domain-containing membrane protein YozV